MKPADRLELIRLTMASIDGTITPEEFAHLDSQICQNPLAADQYAEFMLLYTGLRQPGQGSACYSAMKTGVDDSGFDVRLWSELNAYEQIAEAVDDPAEAEEPATELPLLTAPRIERRISKPAIYTSVLSAAALILLLLYVQLNPLISSPIVGLLTETVDARWHHSSISAQAGQDIRAGRMELQWGLARVRFDSGADVVIEGPAQVEFLTAKSMKLHEGKVYARVGQEAAGFAVFTPAGKVLDIGTEFGVYVKPTGVSQVQVYQGEVCLYPDNASHFVRMFSGDAASFQSGGQLQNIAFQSMNFVRHEEMEARVKSGQDSYYRWKAAVINLHRDPALAAHYFYAQDETNPGRLVNAAPLAGRQTDGQFGDDQRGGPTWVTGRWPNKPAVRFERDKEQVILVGSDRLLSVNGPLTISTWVCFPNPQALGGHLVSCRDEYHVNYQFSFFDDHYFYSYQSNRFEFLRFNEKGSSGAYSRPLTYETDTWYHMATVYDGHAVKFYINGKLYEQKNYQKSIDSRDTQLILGAMKINDRYMLKEGDFDGIVDELMIFSRCLSGAEIQSIYETGVPDASDRVK